MLSTIRTKLRALVEDFEKSDYEVFEYTTSSIFTLAEENINAITKVLKDGNELGSGEYSYDSATNKIEILVSLTSGNLIEVDYTYNKYSDTELNEYIRASLVFISIFSYRSETDYEIVENEIYPIPDNKTEDLISLVGAIIIKPNWTFYKLPTVTVRYPGKMTKEQRIEKLINRYNRGIDCSDVITIE